MQISLKWINELIDIKSTNLNNLINKLTLGGFEVEDIIEIEIDKKKQTALEISSTANRSDSLSIQGISAEITALFDQQLHPSNYLTQVFNWKDKIVDQTKNSKSIDIPECSTFVALTVNNINNINIPTWLQNKLLSSGITPTDTLVDFQNYILLETGYPIAIYDLEKIVSKLNTLKFELKVENAIPNTQFIGTNHASYTLDQSLLVVKANDLPISIAGIIENQNLTCSKQTNSLLIEGSIFNAAKIRQQSRKLALRTDRSARYEKSLKNVYLIEALYRFVSLLRISNSDIECKFHTAIIGPEKFIKPISLSYKTIKEILGPTKQSTKYETVYISTELVSSYLNRLNFNFNFNDKITTWKVEIPPLRSEDITREIDLIEEVGRLHGFDNFLTMLPKIKNVGVEDQSYQTRKKITSCLLNLGLNELIHYSLVSSKCFIKNDIELINPLLVDCSNLRSSLLPSLILTMNENLKQGNSILEGFEYGHVFTGDTNTNFNESEKVAGIFGGHLIKSNWSDQSRKLSWFEAKGKIDKLFTQLNILSQWSVNSDPLYNEILHPYRSAQISLIDGNHLGVFGQIHPLLAKKLALSADLYLFEFDMEQIQKQIYQIPLTIYNEYSVYPKIVKDLSFIIKETISFNEIQNTIYLNGTKFLSQISLIDTYKGQSIPTDCTSLCLQLTFQSKSKTLQNKDVDLIIQNLSNLLKQKFNIILR